MQAEGVIADDRLWSCEAADAVTWLRGLPDGCVNCVVTSPPYFGLRDYGISGQIGLEPTPAEYVARLVEVFREVRRVLRKDGTLWLNLGDSYGAVGGDTHSGFNERYSGTGGTGSKQDAMLDGVKDRRIDTGLRPKNLLGIPWSVAFALRDDGWYLRQDIVWAKPNPMPESVTDRCTKAHEYLFLLSKSDRYHYDADAIAEPATPQVRTGIVGYLVPKHSGRDDIARTPSNKSTLNANSGDSRNRRSVWTIATEPYPGAHFAVMPPALVEPCVLAGCPADGIVADPFAGSGTVLAVAVGAGRRAIGCDLNPKYVRLAARRMRGVTPAIPGVA